MKFSIHIGVHKTGTTLLQRNIAENHAVLRDQGIYALAQEWPGLLDRQLDFIRRLQNTARLPLGPRALARAVRRIVKAAEDGGAHRVLMSEENYLGITIHRQLSWGLTPARFYPRAAECLQLLTHGIDDADLRCVLYARDLGAILRGHYTEGLRAMQMPYSFEEMLDRCDLNSFRFSDLIARIREVRPGAEIVVKRFETIKSGAEAHVRDFFLACGVDPGPLQIVDEVVYPGIDAAQAEAMRLLSVQWRDDPDRRQLRTYLRQISARAPDKALPIRIPEAYQDRVAALTAEDQAQIFDVAA